MKIVYVSTISRCDWCQTRTGSAYFTPPASGMGSRWSLCCADCVRVFGRTGTAYGENRVTTCERCAEPAPTAVDERLCDPCLEDALLVD